MKTVLVAIARLGSSRLPGKVLFDLGGKPVLQWVVERGRACQRVDEVVVATTIEDKDDKIYFWCKENDVKCYRGSENDVLDRFTKAAQSLRADVAVRTTSDCPFIDPHVIDQVIALREATGAEYASNVDPGTWPDGLDCEAICVGTLKLADEMAISKIDRECVTTWIRHNRGQTIKCENLICPLPGMHKERWVLDTEDDYKFCQAIAIGMQAAPSLTINWLTIKRFLDAVPELRKINAHHPRNERYYAALAKEPLPPRSYSRSKELLARAEEIIPLGTQTFSKSKIQYPSESPLFVTHGDGGYCFDVDGNRYVDLVGGLLPNILGHRDPDVDWAIRHTLNNGISHSLATELEIELSELLCRLIPCAEMVRLGKNGTDVTSAAVRLARAITGRYYVVSSGYHGWADWAVCNDEVRNKGVVDNSWIAPLKHGDLITLDRYRLLESAPNSWTNGTAAVIVEPETDVEFLRECRRFCDETGALLIFDEIITGFRFDLGGAQKLYGITPDLACFGKSMANGMPISALVGKREYMKTMEETSYSGTFFGETLSIAAAIACIKKLEAEDVLTKIKKQQMKLLEGIGNDLLNQHIRFPGYIGLPRLTFPDNDVKTLFIQEMAQQGVLIIASHNLCYAHGDNEIERVVTAYKHVLPLISDAIESGSVKQLIKGRSIPTYANVREAS